MDSDTDSRSDFDNLFNAVTMPLNQLAQRIDSLQQPLNNGRGVQVMRSAVTALSRGNLQFARTALHNDWDKLESYPGIREALVGWGVGPKPVRWS